MKKTSKDLNLDFFWFLSKKLLFPKFKLLNSERGLSVGGYSKYREGKIYCWMFTLTLKPKIWKFHIAVWQTTSKKNCTKVRAADAARLFVLIQPIRSMFSGVVFAVASVFT